MSSLTQKVQAISSALDKRRPFCTGVTPLDEHGVLFYRKGDTRDAGYLDFATANEEDLKDLSRACTPICESGDNVVDQENLENETDSRPRKLDPKRFSSMIDLDSSGVAQHVSNELLEGKRQALRFELSVLHVYGEGSYQNLCEPTSLTEDEFAFLVIAFPTPHVGGTSVLRHDDEEWSINTSAILAQQDIPSICFFAILADVEHEVLSIQSGYGVRLIYNLYMEKQERYPEIPELPTTSIHKSIPDQHIFASALSNLIQDETVFPEGGVLAFGLCSEYPLVPSKTSLQQILHVLKGRDAMIRDAAHSHSLKVVLEMVYYDHRYGVDVMYPDILDWNGSEVASWADTLATSRDEGFVALGIGAYEPVFREASNVESVIWITPQTRYSSVEARYINGASRASVSGNLVLAVMVGPPEERETLQEIPSKKKLHPRYAWDTDSDSEE